VDKLKAMGIEPIGGTRESFVKFVDDERTRLGRVVKATGMKDEVSPAPRPPARPRRRLRALAEARRGVVVPGAFNALSARVIADAGFEAIYVTGAGVTNMSLGLPDQGFMGLAEIADHTARIRDAVRPAADRRCRHRLRQRAERAAHGAHARARRRRLHPVRGPGRAQALRPFQRQGRDLHGRGGRQDQGRRPMPGRTRTC
jgi:hypothetical protein